MNIKDIEKHFSLARINRYLNACNGNTKKAYLQYIKNIKLAESFYPYLSILEVSLRNTINTELITYFNDKEWIINQKKGFMMDQSLAYNNFFMKTSVLSTEKKTINKNKTITSDLIISEQNFSFWISFFDSHHYRLIEGAVIKAFPYKPKHINRKEINKKLNRIRKFRNRIYHNEPICFKGNKISYEPSNSIRLEIIETLEWMNPALEHYISTFTRSKLK